MVHELSQSSRPRNRNVLGDLSGGVNSAVMTLPTAIVSGLLAFAPLGPDYASMGVQAGIYGTLVISFIAALLGGAPLQISGARSSLAMIMGAVLAGLLSSSGLPEDPQLKTEVAIALMYMCVGCAGFFQLLFGLFRLGRLIKYLPLSVVSGLINGFAIFILVKQIPVLFGLSTLGDIFSIFSGDLKIIGLAPLCGGVSALITWQGKRVFKHLPSGVLGVAVGTVMFHILKGEESPLHVVGAISFGIPDPINFTQLAFLFDASPDHNHILFSILSSALAIAFLSSILSLLSAVNIDSVVNTRHNSAQELRAQGIANIVASVLGGVVGSGAPARSLSSIQSGANSRRAGLIHSGVLLVILLGFSLQIGQIPLVVLAGVLVVVSFSMLDLKDIGQAFKALQSDRTTTRDYVLTNALTSIAVTIITLTLGFVVAAGLGLVASALMLAMRMEKGIVRGLYLGSNLRSKTSRSKTEMEILQHDGHRICILEIQGAVFFGSADTLIQSLETAAKQADYVILGFRGVTEIDDTAVKMLHQLDVSLNHQGKVLLMSYLHPESPFWDVIESLIQDWSLIHERSFSDLDTALSWAEDDLLHKSGAEDDLLHKSRAEDDLLRETKIDVAYEDELALPDIDLLTCLNAQDIQTIGKFFIRKTVNTGEKIIVKGAASDEMFVLVKGTMSVLADVHLQKRQVRLAHLRPGVMFGEMGLISGLPRSTDVQANAPSVVYVLERQSYEELVQKHPQILIMVMENISMELSRRLRMTSLQVSELEKNL